MGRLLAVYRGSHCRKIRGLHPCRPCRRGELERQSYRGNIDEYTGTDATRGTEYRLRNGYSHLGDVRGITANVATDNVHGNTYAFACRTDILETKRKQGTPGEGATLVR